MTFKHTKFEDSAIMRSLERVAREKGMIKEEPLQKTASNHLNLMPSDSLMENILNLCAGLRVSGFDKYADELEDNYLFYKRATNEIYQTDPKAGEKEIETAHPDGSHKLEGVLGDDLAVIEDILDQHLKMLDVIGKKPHGKLESSAEVFFAVKKALGDGAASAPTPATQTPESADVLVKNAISKISEAVELVVNNSDVGRHAYYIKDDLEDIKKLSLNINVQNVMEMLSIAATILGFVSTGNKGYFSRQSEAAMSWFDAALSDKFKATYRGAQRVLDGGFEMDNSLLKEAVAKIKSGIKLFQDARKSLSQVYKSETGATSAVKPASVPVNTEAQKVLNNYDEVIKAIALYKARINARELPNAVALNSWLDKAGNFAMKYRTNLNNSDFKSDPDILASANKNLNIVKSKVEAFRAKWLP